MSYTDPLIKELKGYTLRVTETFQVKSEITDYCDEVLPLCDVIEKIFLKGSIIHTWRTLDELARIMDLGHLGPKSLSYLRSIEIVRNCPKVKTLTGKLRLFIRTCLVNKCLHVPVEIMVRMDNSLIWNSYDIKKSILGNDILGEIFLSVLLQCSTICFKLDLNNSRFLDVTLTIPYRVCVEFVPCHSLGISITFVDDKAIVIKVDENSVAAEDDKIQVGDVIDELNGHILNSDLKGKLNTILTKGKNKPVIMQLIKYKDPNSDFVYPPIETLIRKINIKLPGENESQSNKQYGFKNMSERSRRSRNLVNYVGSVSVGQTGHVDLIEYAIAELVKNRVKKDWIRVQIECHELGLRVIKEATGEVITCSSFMEVSACGHTRRHPEYFGYISGDNLCNLASKFTCYVFQTTHDSDIHSILQSIREGFQRTHYAV